MEPIISTEFYKALAHHRRPVQLVLVPPSTSSERQLDIVLGPVFLKIECTIENSSTSNSEMLLLLIKYRIMTSIQGVLLVDNGSKLQIQIRSLFVTHYLSKKNEFILSAF